jgi:SNF2 family DNA or RNA helicase
MGQTQHVTVYTYTCLNTIEQRIDEIIRSKVALFDEWIDEVTLDVGAALSEEELFGLFGLRPPRAKENPRSEAGS